MNPYWCPPYIEIIERHSDCWFDREGNLINLKDKKSNKLQKTSQTNQLNKRKIIEQIFHQYQGRRGYYLIIPPENKYVYCGLTKQDVREMLFYLGHGRRGRVEGSFKF